jgi:hypothetical protein
MSCFVSSFTFLFRTYTIFFSLVSRIKRFTSWDRADFIIIFTFASYEPVQNRSLKKIQERKSFFICTELLDKNTLIGFRREGSHKHENRAVVYVREGYIRKILR